MKTPGRCLLSLIVLCLAACDKVYEAHVSVTLPSDAAKNAENVATDLVSHLDSRFDLRCGPPRTCDTSTPSSPCVPELRRYCNPRHASTSIQIVTTGSELTVDISQISGSKEPETFRALRLATEEHLRQSVPEAMVSVEYPVR